MSLARPDGLTLPPRPLGRSSLVVSRLGLGCATFGREIAESDAFALMDYALAHGITLFDTAEAYGGGQARAYRRDRLGLDDAREVSGEMHSSEKIVGRWLRARGTRNQITLVTKVTKHPSAEHVRTALEGSLDRLQTDCVDLYLYHSHDAAASDAESAAAMDAVIRSGRARAGGCSNYTGAQLAAALAAGKQAGGNRFEAVEVPCNLIQSQHDTFPIAAHEQLGVLAYSPLAAGFLTGKYTPDRAAVPKGTRFDVIPAHADIYFSERNFRRVTQLHELAAQTGVPALQLALAWVLQQPVVTSVLVGARTESHLANALAAAALPFEPAWLEQIAAWDASSSSTPAS
jgi:aryl-alcohol dehydrogenase-like predicted oxidoreductase